MRRFRGSFAPFVVFHDIRHLFYFLVPSSISRRQLSSNLTTRKVSRFPAHFVFCLYYIFTSSTIVFLRCPSFHILFALSSATFLRHRSLPRFIPSSNSGPARSISILFRSILYSANPRHRLESRVFLPSPRSMVATTRLADPLARFSYRGGRIALKRRVAFINCHSAALERAACTLPRRACFGQVCLSLVETYFSN